MTATYTPTIPGSGLIVGGYLEMQGQVMTPSTLPGTAPYRISPEIMFPLNSGIYMTERRQSTTSAFGSTLQAVSNITVDITLTGTGASYDFANFSQIWLKMVITNTNGGAIATVLPAIYAIQQIQLYSDGRPIITYSLPRQAEHALMCIENKFEYATTYPLLGYGANPPNTTYATIAAGATREFSIPIHQLMPWLTQMNLKNVGSNMFFRFYMSSGAQFYTSASSSTTLQMSDMYFGLVGHVLDPAAQAELTSYGSMSDVMMYSIYPYYRTQNFGAISASAFCPRYIYQQSGLVVQLYMDIYSNTIGTNGTEDQIGLLSTYQSFQLFDGNGQQLNNNFTQNYQMGQVAAKAYSMGSPAPLLPLTIWTGTGTGVTTFNYLDAGQATLYCDQIASGGTGSRAKGILNSNLRYGAYEFGGRESFILQAPASGGTTWTDCTVNIFFSCLANVILLSNGQIQYQLVAP